jgi:hypothetical protein
MKKIFTFFAFIFLMISGNAQQVSITIDTIYFLPANPSVGDNITLVLSGTANCNIAQQGPAFIADTGHFHSINVCYMGNINTQPSSWAHSYTLYTAQMPGTDTLDWMFDYNKHDTTFCDTVLAMGTFFIQVSPAAVISPEASSLAVNWNSYANTLTFDKLKKAGEFCLTDMSGRILRRETISDERAEIKIPEVQNGIYLVSITDSQGILYRNKIFIARN